MSPMRGLVQRGAGALRARDPRRIAWSSSALCERERCPFACRHRHRRNTGCSSSRTAVRRTARSTCRSGAARQAAEDDAAVERAPARAAAARSRRSTCRRRAARAALPGGGDKTFLITIGDRTVGGLCSRDQMVGPGRCRCRRRGHRWPTSRRAGEAMAMGERTPLALIDGPASARMAVGEAITNIAAARIATWATSSCRPTGWPPPGIPARTRRSTTRCARSASSCARARASAIPVGKDSMSMRTSWDGRRRGPAGRSRRCRSIVSAFAPATTCAATLTPQLRTRRGRRADAGRPRRGRNRLGGSVLAQVYGQLGDAPPDLDDPGALRAFFDAIQDLNARRIARVPRPLRRRPVRDAVRDGVRQPGGRWRSTLDGQAPAARPTPPGRAVQRRARRGAPGAPDGRLLARSSRRCRGRSRARWSATSAHDRDRAWISAAKAVARSSRTARALARTGPRPRTSSSAARQPAVRAGGVRRAAGRVRPGPARALTFDPRRTSPPRSSPRRAARPRGDPARAGRERPDRDGGGVRPRRLRGGRRAHERHHRGARRRSPTSRARRLRRLLLRRRAGRGRGLGQVDPVQRARARRVRRVLPPRGHVRAGRVQRLPDDEQPAHAHPGAPDWPHFVRNRSEQFEARLVAGRGPRSPSLFFAGMAGSRIPIATAHGEGSPSSPTARQLADARPGGARASSTTAAGRRRATRQPERLARRASPASPRRRPLHDPHAAPRARVQKERRKNRGGRGEEGGRGKTAQPPTTPKGRAGGPAPGAGGGRAPGGEARGRGGGHPRPPGPRGVESQSAI